MDIDYYMKIQNAYGTKSKREKDLVKVNQNMAKHLEDTFDAEDVLINGSPKKLMIIKDSDGNVFKKKIKSCNSDMFNLGDYVIWNNQHWIIMAIDPDEKTWNRGFMYLCSVPLRWQNSDGEIVERWAYSEDFTKYSSGVIGNNTVQLGDNQYGLTIPIDEETIKLKREVRFPIDCEGVEQPDIYKLTNRKANLSNHEYFGRGGIMIITASYTEFNPEHDKKVALDDGSEVWIADYRSPTIPTPPDETPDSWSMRIDCNNYYIKPTGIERTFKAHLYDSNKNEITKDIAYVWTVESVAQKYINYSTSENLLTLSLSSDCEDYFGEMIHITCASKFTGHQSTIELEIEEVF